MAYITPADLRGTPWNVTEEEASDELLASLISAAQDYIEAFCGVRFEPEHATLRLEGSGTRVLFLPRRAISVTRVLVDGEERTGFTCRGRYLEVDPGQAWVFDEPTGARLNVEVEGTWGLYPEVPEAIRRVCARLVLRELRPREAVGRYRSERIGDYSYTLAEGPAIPGTTGDPEIDRVLLAFRRRSPSLSVVRGQPERIPRLDWSEE